MVETGVYCTNPDALQERLIVWEGLALVPRAEADACNAAIDDVPLVLPRGLGRAATMKETMSIIATPATKRVIQLCRLPRDIGELLIGQRQDALRFDQYQPYEQLTEHISGRYVSSREDAAGQLTVTLRDSSMPDAHPPVKVGFHIDTWKDEDFKLMVVNAGPGVRWHCIAPSYTRSIIGGAGRQDRIDYFEQHPDNDAKVFGMRLDPPNSHYEAVVNSPVAHLLHDGSTIAATESSTAVFIASKEIAIGAYPSPLYESPSFSTVTLAG